MLAEEASPLILAAVITFRFGMFATGKAFGLLLILQFMQALTGYGNEIRIRIFSEQNRNSEEEIEHSFSARLQLLFPAMLSCLLFHYDAITILTCWLFLFTGFILRYQRMIGQARSQGITVHRISCLFSVLTPIAAAVLIKDFNLYTLLLLISSSELLQWVLHFLINPRMPSVIPRLDISYICEHAPYMVTSLFQFVFMNCLLLFAVIGFDTLTVAVAAWLSLMIRISITLSGILVQQAGDSRYRDFVNGSDKGQAIFILTAILNALLMVLLYHNLNPWLPGFFSSPFILAGLYLLVMFVYLITHQSYEAGRLRSDAVYHVHRMTHSVIAIQLLCMVLILFAGLSFSWLLLMLLGGYALRYGVTWIQLRKIQA